MKKQQAYTTIWIAIAFSLACKELARRTGVHAMDWHKELQHRALKKINRFSDGELARYIKENFEE
ncbi:hypothetical protein [Gloeocapsopsis sp. IPPAS B-1203]|uniref:hypothetical protein n=1 Tax=Gloeocapsopsis sp. IPPAS B-1203 TaxID=2049454 RepID=UPI000C17E0CF|nr:hypothetical protein [Gloeocapsopsis sp. IPPAS B-1203]PIG90812.1 hypothetical protein CSQ79_24505 [Gloeocapsopsis sp. IPPAS B-1203]